MHRFRLPRALALAPAFLLVACGDDGDDAKTVKIAAGDIARLEAVTADAKYAGYRIELAPGTYQVGDVLTLQPGQQLVGAQRYVDHDGDGVWDPTDAALDPVDPAAVYVVAGTETVLDGASRNDSSIVLMSPGSSLEGLTIRGKDAASESADTFGDYRFLVDMAAPTGDDGIEIRDSLFARSYHAINIGGSGAVEFRARLEGNVFFDNREAVVIGTYEGDGTRVHAELVDNRLSSYRFVGDEATDLGIAISIQGTGCVAEVVTEGNIIDQLSSGSLFVTAGFNLGPEISGMTIPSNQGNSITWTSTGDSIWRNGNPAAPNATGAVLIFGAFEMASSGITASGNTIDVDFVGTAFVKPGVPRAQQNHTRDPGGVAYRQDVSSFGAYFGMCGGTGDGNDVTLTFEGATSDNKDEGNPCANTLCTSLYAIGNLHAGDGANSVTVLPADPAAFEAVNPGFAAPFVVPEIGPPCGTPTE